jgi:hypothetical protein
LKRVRAKVSEDEVMSDSREEDFDREVRRGVYDFNGARGVAADDLASGVGAFARRGRDRGFIRSPLKRARPRLA